MKPSKDLVKFLKPFPLEVRTRVLSLREFIWDLYPQANELIYDTFNALAIGWSLTDKVTHTFCTMAVYRTNFNHHFGFYYGSVLNDFKNILLGGGNQYRYILVNSLEDFPKSYIKKLLKEAYTNSLKRVKDPKQILNGQIITKSVSSAKRSSKRPFKKK